MSWRSVVDALCVELRRSVRSVRRMHLGVLLSLTTLGAAFAVSVAVSRVLEAVFLNPLGFPGFDRLVSITEFRSDAVGVFDGYASFGTYADLKEQARALDAIALVDGVQRNRTGVYVGRDGASKVAAMRTTASLFEVLAAIPLVGRVFLPSEERPGGEPVALVSEHFWRRELGEGSQAVGSAITVDQLRYTVVGVMPEWVSRPPFSVDLWLPIVADPSWREDRGALGYSIVGRLRDRATLTDAQTQAQEIYSLGVSSRPELQGFRLRIGFLTESVVGQLRRPVGITLLGVACVLLIACTSVGSVLLARAWAYQSNLATRAAIGAMPAHLAMHFLSDSIVLSAGSGAVGLVVGLWACGALSAFAPEGLVSRALLNSSLRTSIVVVPLTMVTAGASAVIPALVLAREGLRVAGRGATLGSTRRVRTAQRSVIAFQVGTALMLSLVAVLLGRSYLAASHEELGFAPDGLLTFETSLRGTAACEWRRLSKQWPYYDQLLGVLEGVPGVESAGIASALPIVDKPALTEFAVEGADELPIYPMVALRTVSASLLRTMGTPLLRGRHLGPEDVGTAEDVALVNETMAGRFGGADKAVGRRFRLNPKSNTDQWIRVAGVVANARFGGLEGSVMPDAYLPHSQMPMPVAKVVVRTRSSKATVFPALRTAIERFDSDLPLSDVKPMNRLLSEALAGRRFGVTMMVVFSALVLGVTAVGVHGLQSLLIEAEAPAFAVRMALGATPGDLVGGVLVNSLRLCWIGIGIGGVLYLIVARWVSPLLYGVSAFDVVSIGICLGVVSLTVLVGSYLPARRLARMDPSVLLRRE